jgi:hypothetical protein
MADKQRLIRKRLGKLGLGTRREEEILHELGDHVEDHAAALEARGVAREAATREALNSVSDWPELRKQILEAENEEGTVNYRTKVLWLPALFALAMSSGLLALLQYFGLLPRFYYLSMGFSTTYLAHRVGPVLVPPTSSFTLYIPWVIALPVVGAVTAFCSLRAGGKARHRILAALAPSLVWLCFLLVSPVISSRIYTFMYLLDLRHGNSSFPLISCLTTYLTHLVSWVLGPSILLFLGAAPFLRKPQAQS